MPYRFDRIDPSKAARIVVDMQNDFVAEGAKLQEASLQRIRLQHVMPVEELRALVTAGAPQRKAA